MIVSQRSRRLKSSFAPEISMSPIAPVFSQAELSNILKRPESLVVEHERILEALDPHAEYDDLLGLENTSLVNDQIVVNLSEIKSKLFSYDPGAWGTLIIIKYYERDHRVYPLRIKSPPSTVLKNETPLGNLGDHLDKYVCVRGNIKRVTTTANAIVYHQFACKNCGTTTGVNYDWYTKLKPPECRSCSSKKELVELPSSRLVQSWQSVNINPAASTETIHDLELRVLDNRDYDQFVPGEEIVAHGILKCTTLETATRHFYLDVQQISPIKIRKRKISSKGASKYHQFLDNHGQKYWARLKKLVFSGVSGLQKLKDVGLLQLFGGASWLKRSNMHFLYVGDPSTGKSAILRKLQNQTGGTNVLGMGATSAGLTATAYKEATGAWALDGGALVSRKSKAVYLDELDKLPKSGQVALLEAMEQQTVSVSKAGMNIVLPANCSVLAACNPKIGSKFSPDRALVDQLGLDPALLSRFDLIVPVLIDSDQERVIFENVLFDEKGGADCTLGEDLDGYIEYARTLEPIISDELKKKIYQFFMDTKKKYSDANLPLSVRQLEGVLRIITAKARSRLSEEVSESDWDFAKKLIVQTHHSLVVPAAAGVDAQDLKLLVPIDLITAHLTKDDQSVLDKIKSKLNEAQMTKDHCFLLISQDTPDVRRKVFDKCFRFLEDSGSVFKPDGRNYKLLKKSTHEQ